jgi:hypothetical protein
MGFIRKYAFVLALVVVVIYVYAPLTRDDIAKLRWLDDINIIISRVLATAKPGVGVSQVDPIAAANVNEDLDYRIAQRTKSTEGWRSFLTAHPDGPHAESGRAELDKLALSVTSPAAVRAPDHGPRDAAIPGEGVSTQLPSPGTESATFSPDEICRDDESRLEKLSRSPTNDGVVRFLIELRCEKLRPQLLRLAERLDDRAPTASADAAQEGASAQAARSRTSESQRRTHFTRASHRSEARRRPNRSTAQPTSDSFGLFRRATEEPIVPANPRQGAVR